MSGVFREIPQAEPPSAKLRWQFRLRRWFRRLWESVNPPLPTPTLPPRPPEPVTSTTTIHRSFSVTHSVTYKRRVKAGVDARSEVPLACPRCQTPWIVAFASNLGLDISCKECGWRGEFH